MQRFKNILYVASDLNHTPVLKRTITLAQNNQAKLTVVCVIDKIPSSAGRVSRTCSAKVLREQIINDCKQQLNDMLAPERDKLAITAKAVIGIPVAEVIREVFREQHDLVIKSTTPGDKRGFNSFDVPLLRKCPCPVWLIQRDAFNRYPKILAAVDVNDFCLARELKVRSALNRQILELSVSLALSESAQLHIAQTWEAVGEDTLRGPTRTSEKELATYIEEVRQQREQKLNNLIAEINDNLGNSSLDYIKPHTHLIQGSSRDEIPEFVSQIAADLVVIGTMARAGISGLLMGNTAETLLTSTPCSILAIKPPGFVSSVT